MNKDINRHFPKDDVVVVAVVVLLSCVWLFCEPYVLKLTVVMVEHVCGKWKSSHSVVSDSLRPHGL